MAKTATKKKPTKQPDLFDTPRTAKSSARKTMDRKLISGMEDYEVKYLATKHGVTQRRALTHGPAGRTYNGVILLFPQNIRITL